MILDDREKIQTYCEDMQLLWSHLAGNFQTNPTPEIGQESVVESMMFLCEGMARFFAQVSTSCPAIQKSTSYIIFFLLKIV